MKRILLLLAAGLFFNLSVQAQKMGYINTDELMATMPEVTKVYSDLEKYSKEFQTQGEAMLKERLDKIAAFEKDFPTMTDAMKEARQKEIVDLETRIQAFDTSSQQKMQAKNTELMKPIYERIRKAIQDVGKEGGYQYILDAGGLLYAQDSDNVISQVKAKLGIK